MPKYDDCTMRLKKRTPTNLTRNAPPGWTWPIKQLDEAVIAVYGWETGMSDDELLTKLLELNLERASTEAAW